MHRHGLLSLVSATALVISAGFLPAQEGKSVPDVTTLRAEAREALQGGEFEAAAAGFRRVTAAAPDDGTSWQLLGYCLHALGKLDEALPVHKRAAEFPEVAAVASYNAACVYALQGKVDEAFGWLDKAATAGFDRPEHIEGDSDMDVLRKDPRFAKILERINKQAGPDRMQVFAIQNERKCARVAWFNRAGSPGQIAIQYSPVAWRDKYDAMVDDAAMLGKKWRFGADFWTSLDNSVDLLMGGVTVPAGYYYLTVAQHEPGKFVLGIHDAAEVKKQRIDAFQAERLQGGIEVPLVHDTSEDIAEELGIAIKVKSGSKDHGKFVVRFGGHALTAPVLMKVGSVPGPETTSR
ncbi:MAG: DUF2911 domain-containing protein [Planctomycetes bacterium]|nr:DUF2911 domain-containing protein [Planctomycetota bacterium]